MAAVVRFGGLAALVVLAFGARSLGVASVFTPLGVIPFGSDAWYHLRRVAYGLRNFPSILEFDPYLNHPAGGQTIWTPTFDWLLTALAKLAVADPTPAAVERFLVWVPPALGALTVVAVYRVGARHFSPAVGLAAGAVLALLPASIHFSRLGFVDHHVAVALVSVLLFGAGMDLLAEPTRRARAVRLGLWIAGAFMLWAGSLLHLTILEVFFVGYVFLRAEREDAVAWAWRLALVHGVAALAVAPLALRSEWETLSRFAPEVLSDFQPIFLGAAALAWAAAASAWRQDGVGASPARRVFGALGVGAAGIGLALLVPDLREALLYALRWFTAPELGNEYVSELRPLFFPTEAFDPRRAEMTYSRALYVFPFVWLALAASARRSEAPAPVALFVCWAAGMALFAILQRRFSNSLAPVFSLVVGWGVVAAGSAARSAFASRPVPVALAVVAALALVPMLVRPSLAFYGVESYGLGAALRGEPTPLKGFQARQARQMKVGRWIRRNTPATSGFLDPSAQPEYGVLANWGDGHLLRYVARRPMIQDNFVGVVDGVGSREGFLLAEDYFAALEEVRAVELSDQLGFRYVVLSPTGSGHTAGYEPESLYVAMRLRTGSALGDFPALRRHRMVFELHPGAAYRVFERVAGAQVVGRALPDAVVEARLPLRTENRTYEYVQRAHADAEGNYELRLPYATPGSQAVETAEAWEVVSGDRAARLRVDEAAVTEGRRLAGPDLTIR